MRFETEQTGLREVSTPQDLEAALATLDPARNSFAILQAGDQTYLQTSIDREGFVVERRDGNPASHAKAMRTQFHATLEQDRFDRAEMTAIFAAYLAGQPTPASVRWEPLVVPHVGAAEARISRLVPIAIVAILVALALAIVLANWG